MTKELKIKPLPPRASIAALGFFTLLFIECFLAWQILSTSSSADAGGLFRAFWIVGLTMAIFVLVGKSSMDEELKEKPLPPNASTVVLSFVGSLIFICVLTRQILTIQPSADAGWYLWASSVAFVMMVIAWQLLFSINLLRAYSSSASNKANAQAEDDTL